MKKIIVFILSLFMIVGTVATSSSCKSKKKLTGEQKHDMKAAYNELKKEIPEALVTYEDDKVKLVFPEALLFEVNSTDVNTSYLPTLAKIGKVMNKFPETSVLIS